MSTWLRPDRGTSPLGRAALRIGFAGCAFGMLFALVHSLWHTGANGPTTDSIDYRAFYCAGDALVHGADPYRVGWVRACTRAALQLAGLPFSQGHVLIAPLPPAILGVFALFALLPYRLSIEVWLTVCLVALCVTVVVVSRLSAVRPIYVALTLAASLGFGSLFYGQLVPVVAAALVCAAFAARRRNGPACAVALTVAAIEPNLALPAWIATFVFVPDVRRALIVAALAVVALSAAYHPALLAAYFHDVLPAHARSEVYDFAGQYSLSAFLVWLGMAPPLAVTAGSLSYVVMLAVGCGAGGALARRFTDPAFVVLAPPAFVTLGGPYVHGHQIAAAIPFAWLLYSRLDVRVDRVRRAVLIGVFIALAVPWRIIAIDPRVMAQLPQRSVVPRANFRVPADDEPIERSYTERVDAIATQDVSTRAVRLAWKLPSWLALVALMTVSLVTLRRRVRDAPDCDRAGLDLDALGDECGRARQRALETTTGASGS